MTLHGDDYRVGVRDLHDRLSEHLERVERGVEVVVTRRGSPIARISAIEQDSGLEQLVQRGLVTPPVQPRSPKRPATSARGSVSQLVTDQRR